jgi:hypothetical protein
MALELGRDVADDARLNLQAVFEGADRVLPALLRVGDHGGGRACARGRTVALRIGLLDALDVEGDVLRLAEQRLGLGDRRLKLGQRRHRKVGEIARLVHQRRRLVGRHRDLIVDLLQLARGGEHVLTEIGRVVDDPLRRGGPARRRPR